MGDFNPQDFIQDFYEEATEHLRSIQANFLALERSLTSARPTVETAVERVDLLEELFRSFHTLKGLAGMIGLEAGAELSHAVESILREVQNTRLELTPRLIDRLLAASRTLADLVESVRVPGKPPADVSRELEAIAAFLSKEDRIGTDLPTRLPGAGGPPAFIQSVPAEVAAGLNELDRQKIQATREAGHWIFLAVFKPEKEKSGKDINVNTVRQQLLERGEILKAVPLIDGSAVQFAFLVASRQAPDLAAMRAALPGLHLEALPGLDPAQADGQTAVTPGDQAREEQGERSSPPVSSLAGFTIRVEPERINEVMRLVGELVVSRSRLAEGFTQLPRLASPVVDGLQQTLGKMDRYLRDLRYAALRMRMVPLSEVFSHMPLVTRDLGRALGKEVRLRMVGESTEIDRMLADRLLDPLLHLVRNALSHGIETPAERLQAGKGAQGTLILRGQLEGDNFLVSVSDDGQGVDFEQVAAKAVSLGWMDHVRLLEPAEALELLCRPGFTTLDQATLGAGRGVGLEVVFKMVASVGGSLSMDSQPGQGTTFTLRLPLTLTIFSAILVECGGERYAIPQSAVNEVIEIDPEQIVRLESGELFPYHQGSLALIRLSSLFHLAAPVTPRFLYGLVGGNGGRQAALVVDKLGGLREVVARTVSDPLVARPGILGATELGDGNTVLILDLPGLILQKND